MKKKKNHDEHVDEAWLLPYSDMLTLLLALFIIMFAIGQTDKQKFKAMAEEFNVIFSGSSGFIEGSDSTSVSMDGQNGKDSNITINAKSDSEIEQDRMQEIKLNLDKEISKQGYSDKIKVDLNGEGLEISIQDVVLFDSGKADIVNDMSPLLIKISELVKGLNNNIKIVGHSDNEPISNNQYHSNWDLSSSRAINVMNFMVKNGGIKEDNLSIEAYGPNRPVSSNDTNEGKAKNRRVEIIISRNYPEDKDKDNNKK